MRLVTGMCMLSNKLILTLNIHEVGPRVFLKPRAYNLSDRGNSMDMTMHDIDTDNHYTETCTNNIIKGPGEVVWGHIFAVSKYLNDSTCERKFHSS